MAHEPHLRGPAPSVFDRDLHVGWVVGFGAGIAAIVVAGGVVCAAVLSDMRGDLARSRPGPSPIPEERLPVVFAEPRLQVAPRLAMSAYRAEETRLLTTFGWSDRARQTVRIPIGRAMELYAEGRVAPAPAPSGPPGGGAP